MHGEKWENWIQLNINKMTWIELVGEREENYLLLNRKFILFMGFF